MSRRGRCKHCDGALPAGKGHQTYCSPKCRKAWHRADWKRRNPTKQRAYERRAHSKGPPQFVGVDSEAIDGDMVLVTMATGTGTAYTIEAEEGGRIESAAAFEWLISHARSGRVMVGFWFDYDVNHFLADLERRHLLKLAENGKCFWGDYFIAHVPGKRFYVRNRRTEKGATVWDVSGFVRASFVRLLRGWEVGTVAEVDRISDMKDQRADFGWDAIDAIKEYNADECRLLAQAARKIWQAARDAGIPLRDYYGGGSLAGALMRRHNINSYAQRWPDHEIDQTLAYFGGRFETSIVGLHDKPVHCYDINSAYPWAVTQLPCLAHGRWIKRRNPTPGPGLHFVTWNVDGWFGPFPVRRSRGLSLCYPTDNPHGGWYWWPEVEAAIRLYPEGINIERTLSWEPGCDHVPFDWVHDEARKRLALKAEGDYAAQMLKLGLNSMYGKLAQRVGRAPFYNPTWAGMTTAMVRALLLNGIAAEPDAILSMATDSLFSSAPLPLPLGERLGEWESVTVPWMFFAQGGVYFWPGDEGIVHKSRGFTGRGLTYDRVRRAWSRYGINGTVPIPQTRFVGYRSALRRKEDVWRVWLKEQRRLSFDPAPRRRPWRKGKSYWRTRPPSFAEVDAATLVDLIYRIDLRLADLELLEQPDPEEVRNVFDE